MKLSGLAVIIFAQATVLADGGTVLLHKEAGDLVITVFASPTPLSVGPVDISLLLQNKNGLEPVLDASVSLLLHADGSNPGGRATATREQASNKLLYAAPVTFPQSGKWQMTVTVQRKGEETTATGVLEVAPAADRAASYASYIAFPPLMVGLFVIREWLIRQKAKG